MKDVDIVIPTFNRAEALNKVLESYLRAAEVRKVIIVDDASDAENASGYRAASERHGSRVIYIRSETRLGQQRARKAGLQHVDAPVMIFGEDDVWVSPDYIPVLANYIISGKADIASGRLINSRVGLTFSERDLELTDSNGRANKKIFDLKRLSADYAGWAPKPVEAPYLHTIAAISTRVFKKVTFDEKYGGTAHREETDFYISAAAIGFRILFCPEVTCYHIRGPLSSSGGHRGSGVKYIHSEYWALMNTYRLVRKHWQVCRKEYGFRISPLFYICSVFVPFRISNALRKLSRKSRSW